MSIAPRSRGAAATAGLDRLWGAACIVRRSELCVSAMASALGSRRRSEGVVVRHARGCAARAGGRCGCRPGFQAQVWSARDAKTIRKTFRTLADARAWRADAHDA
jgi:hypothetical protein